MILTLTTSMGEKFVNTVSWRKLVDEYGEDGAGDVIKTMAELCQNVKTLESFKMEIDRKLIYFHPSQIVCIELDLFDIPDKYKEEL